MPELLREKRNRAILAILLGCGLRRRELATPLSITSCILQEFAFSNSTWVCG